ncbi:HTH-type transcriptional regulator Xre [Clostridium acetireducens DSM 10703]|jgi:transcriptional regulator with XRE-family HTH domain|uniref:HTH-type transcriptional regulator Xre n=1 Tax=Clostridium acetireducens DSM 10703 TaxID=1121290 RepID=A0A1E8EZG1_9CLOT|nr:helix-turn-helix transcriptional regulator [Clostridium acetireducens]OFI06090.1 HTH-type transcriptional regulator Xre [Clostridium acetireducens DSM 10703]
MNRLSIGEVIFELRKEKGITQDQLGNFVGVSTAAVSKWESGISYPDITMLPVLATFFNVSIDKLLNFKVDLSDEEVMKIFSECEAIFSKGDLYEAINKSKEYVLKYPTSYYLKLRIGFLFNVYSWKENNEKKRMDIIAFSIKLFEDVAKNCTEIKIVDQALFQLGALYQVIEEEDKAIEALNKISKSELETDIVLAGIYIKKNKFKKARELLQTKLYKNINEITFVCMGLANSYIKDEKNLSMAEKYNNLSINIKKAVSSNKDSVLSLSMEYLNFAENYLKFNEKEKAIKMLKNMVDDIKNNDINKPDKFRDIWCFNEVPKSERTITMNLYENIFKVFEQPVFDSIRESEEFTRIINDLKDLEKKSLS